VRKGRELESYYLCIRYHRVTQSLQVAAAFFAHQICLILEKHQSWNVTSAVHKKLRQHRFLKIPLPSSD
jgi:hypothetical protein